ncbi:MAG: AAA family ATPase [bacterium]
MQAKNKPFLLVLDGPMGTGKTTVSKLLHAKLEGTARVGFDDVKKFIYDFQKDHEYKKISQKVILAMANEYLKSGINVITEWVMKKERVADFMKIAKKNDARFFTYELDAPKELLIKRVKERNKKSSTVLKPKQSISELLKNFEKNYDYHSKNRHNHTKILNSEKLTPEQIARKILRDMIY